MHMWDHTISKTSALQNFGIKFSASAEIGLDTVSKIIGVWNCDNARDSVVGNLVGKYIQNCGRTNEFHYINL